MDMLTITTNNSYSHPFSPNCSESSFANSEGSQGMSISNEEVRLAATTPKKRAGRKKFQETRHPVYRGVRKRNLDKWVCEMREPNKKTKIWLGTFPTAEMAARAHDVASMALRGRYACLNFADSAWRLPIPATTQAKDIQKAAAQAAEAFRPDKTSMTNDIDTAIATSSTEEQSRTCMEEEEEGTMNMPELLRNMALMSPTHSFGYDEYEDIHVQDFPDFQDFQDEEVSLSLQEILHFARGGSPGKMQKALANGRLPGVLPGAEYLANPLIANDPAKALAPGKCAPGIGPGTTPGKMSLHNCRLL